MSNEQSQTNNAQDCLHDDASAARQAKALYSGEAKPAAGRSLDMTDSKEVQRRSKQRSVRFNLTNTSMQLAASDTAHAQRKPCQSNAPGEAKPVAGQSPNTADSSERQHISEPRSVLSNLANESAQLAASDTAHAKRQYGRSNAPGEAEAKLAAGRPSNTTHGGEMQRNSEQRSLQFDLMNGSAQLAASDTACAKRQHGKSRTPGEAEAKLAAERSSNTPDGGEAQNARLELVNTSAAKMTESNV